MVDLEGLGLKSWTFRKEYLDYHHPKLYLAALYWSFQTMSTVGFGDIAPMTTGEILLAMGWELFGVCFFSFTIGSLSSMMSTLDMKEAELTHKL
jgi:hyperpolarization activated cyclic nucleotide-gated potassium channel 1